MKTKQIKKAILRKKKVVKLAGKDFVSTGSTLLNLACTGFPDRGFAKGYYYFIVGDSESGKTWLALTCLAEASINKNFDDYRFIYDNTEDGALMDIKTFFGTGVANRLTLPGKSASFTIEDFYYNVDDAINDGRPFIYIQDSMDSLSSQAEVAKFVKTKVDIRKGQMPSGTMTAGKAKINSSMLRRVIGDKLEKSGSILVILNQTRMKMNAMPFESPKTYSGGKALKFYACVQIMSSVSGQIMKTVLGKKRQQGIYCRASVRKNRFRGQKHSVIIPIYHSLKTDEGAVHGGIDDVGSCVDYLISEGHWEKKGNEIKAKGLGISGSRKKLIKIIEEKNYEKDLSDLVGDVWQEIEIACQEQRKKRYE